MPARSGLGSKGGAGQANEFLKDCAIGRAASCPRSKNDIGTHQPKGCCMKLNGRALELLMMMSVQPDREMSGYEIGKSLSVSSGTLYPLLVRAEEAGFLTARWECGNPQDLGRPRRRYYKITGLGASNVSKRLGQLNLQVAPLGTALDAGTVT